MSPRDDLMITQIGASLSFVPQMQGVTFAASPLFTLFAIPLAHPVAISKRLISIFPYIEEIVVADVALHKSLTDIGAGRDGAVRQKQNR